MAEALGPRLLGKRVATEDAVTLLETAIEPGDRVCLEGNNQKQADFLAEALAACDPARVHDLHLVQSVLALPSHMSLATFYRAIVALRSYFPTIAALGAARAPWRSLKAHGEAAEAVMLHATGNVNTHRGAIFHLGLLCAAIGALSAEGRACTSRAACACG